MIFKRPYNFYQGAKVKSEIYLKSYAYALGVTPTKYDIYDGQYDKNKLFYDALYGKMGEDAAYQILKKYDINVSAPDYEVKKAPSWESDLKKFMGNDIAVKTQNIDSKKRYGLGWTFQYQLFKRCDPILNKPYAWVCFVLCGNLTIENELKCIVFPLVQVKDLKYRPAALPHLNDKKKFVDGPKLYTLLGIPNDGVLELICSFL